MVALLLLVCGAVLAVVSVAQWSLPAAGVVAGSMLIAAGLDLGSP